MSKRPSCDICLRPDRTCICKHIRCVGNQVSVVILQHPLETREAKNTGRLLHLCLKNSQLFVGETFDDKFASSMDANKFEDLLLYPDTPDSQDLATPLKMGALYPNDTEADGLEARPLRLWVIDATWRKSRKMLYLNSFLQKMPRVSLDNSPSSLYTIRKAHSENQLSSLEASCYALQRLEANAVDYSPVLTAFTAFIAEQQTFLPHQK